eukprot:31316-Pelagococcus_subviridis.AAC.18
MRGVLVQVDRPELVPGRDDRPRVRPVAAQDVRPHAVPRQDALNRPASGAGPRAPVDVPRVGREFNLFPARHFPEQKLEVAAVAL